MLLTAAELSVHYSQAPGCTTANLMNKPFRSGLPSTPKVDSKLTDSVWDKMDGIRYTNISVLGSDEITVVDIFLSQYLLPVGKHGEMLVKASTDLV